MRMKDRLILPGIGFVSFLVLLGVAFILLGRQAQLERDYNFSGLPRSCVARRSGFACFGTGKSHTRRETTRRSKPSPQRRRNISAYRRSSDCTEGTFVGVTSSKYTGILPEPAPTSWQLA